MADPASHGPPPHGERRVTVVNGLLAINVAVFLLWIWATVPIPVMADHFLVSWSHLADGRVWTLLTALFSHNLLFHLAVNMIVLMSFGPPMEQAMGAGRFLVFYLIAGLVGSFAHAATSNFLIGAPARPALGASSALAGLLLFFSLSFPKARVLLFFIIPLPAIVAALGFVAIDIWGLIAQIEGQGLPIGHGAHLGGAVVGAVYYVVARKGLRRETGGVG